MPVTARRTSRVQAPLETYLKEINETALLTAADERELAGTDPVEGVDFFQRRNVARADLNGLETSGS